MAIGEATLLPAKRKKERKIPLKERKNMLTMNYKALRETYGRAKKHKNKRKGTPAQTKPKQRTDSWARTTIWSMESSEPQKLPRKPSKQSSGETTKQTYKEQLEHPKWLKKRKAILERDNHQCALCGSKENLQVHHTEYRDGKRAWEYPNAVLVTLCRDCHEKVHADPDHKLNPYRKRD